MVHSFSALYEAIRCLFLKSCHGFSGPCGSEQKTSPSRTRAAGIVVSRRRAGCSKTSYNRTAAPAATTTMTTLTTPATVFVQLDVDYFPVYLALSSSSVAKTNSLPGTSRRFFSAMTWATDL